MPADAGQFFYDCKGCGQRLNPSRAIVACSAHTDRYPALSTAQSKESGPDQGIEGAYAEKIAIKAALVARKPDRLTHSDAAIEDTAQLKAGQTILIQGGAGGVAGFAVQLAKHFGATVIATASAGNHPYVRSLGADRVIDYNSQDFTAIGPICDVVFDTVGGNVRAGCYAVLKPGGKLVWIAPAPEGFQPNRNDFQTLRPDVKRDRAHLERMLALLNAGAIRPPRLSGTSSLMLPRRTGSAKRDLQGKLVLKVR
jgi:NADPH:quinone reductase-like Zn-dependent oxidoreductase